METGPDAFLDYFTRRLSHHRARLEKVSKYRAVDASQLNDDQRNLLADGERAEGKCEETEFLKEKYKTHLNIRTEQQQKELAEAREQGRAEAYAEFNSNLQLLSKFLNSMSLQYRTGRFQTEDSRESYAYYKLLQQFYGGDEAGGLAMKNFIEGADDAVCENGVKFSELKSSLLDPSKTMDPAAEPQPMPSNDNGTDVNNSKNSSNANGNSNGSSNKSSSPTPGPGKAAASTSASSPPPSSSASSSPTGPASSSSAPPNGPKSASKQASATAGQQKASKPAPGNKQPTTANGKSNNESSDDAARSRSTSSENLSRQNSVDQFQIVGANKSKDKGGKTNGVRRKGNQKKTPAPSSSKKGQ